MYCSNLMDQCNVVTRFTWLHTGDHNVLESLTLPLTNWPPVTVARQPFRVDYILFYSQCLRYAVLVGAEPQVESRGV